MQKGKKLVIALLLAIGITGAVGFAPEATLAKSRTKVTHHVEKGDDHGRHGHGHDDRPGHH